MLAITHYLVILSLAFAHAQEHLPAVEIRFSNGEKRNTEVVQVGSRVEMICNFTAAIPPVTWLRNNRVVSPTEKISINDNLHQLSISFSAEHAGNYTCVAGNPNVGIFSSNTVTLEAKIVSVRYNSEDGSQPFIVPVLQGHPQTIDCLSINSSHPVDVLWNFMDSIPVTLQHDFAVESANQSLIVVNPSPHHDGDLYRCTLDPAGPFGYVQLVYEASDETVPLSIVSPPRDVVTIRGESVRFDCIQGGTGAQQQISTWTVPNGYETNIRKFDRGFTLIISSVVDQNAGIYSCSNGRINVSAQLTIIDPPVISSVTSTTQSTSVVYGSPIMLLCLTLSNPHPPTHWEWFHNGGRLFDQNGPTMVVESAALEHSGIYQCMVYNPAGYDSVATPVQVIIIPAAIREDLPANQLIFRDHPFTVNCSAIGAPPPRFTWFKGTIPLETSSSFQVDSSEGSLIINNVEASSDGRYECQVENSIRGPILGRASTSTNLFSIVPTVIQRQLGEMFSIQVGTTAIIPCEAFGDETVTLTYSWTKDGSPLSTDSGRIQFVNASVNGDLRIGPVEFEDSGVYQCSVNTERNRLNAPVVRSMSTSLTITETPVAPIITFINATSMQSFHVRWNFLGPLTSVSNYIIEVQPYSPGSSDDIHWMPVQTRFVGAVTVADVSSDSLMPFTEYRVRVVATYTSGVSVPSQFVVIVTEEGTPADGPGHLNGQPTPNNSAIMLFWNPPSEPRGTIIDYVIQYRDKDEEEFMSENIGSNATSYLINGLQEFQMYEVRVAGMTGAGVGVFSGVIIVHLNHAGLQEPESGPFVTSIGFIVLVVAVVVAGVVTLVVAILVVKRRAVKSKQARNYALRHSGYFGKDNVIDMECIDASLSESTMSSYRSGRKRGFTSPTGSRQDAMERESSIGNGTEYTMTGTPQLSTASSTRLILHNTNAPSYIDPPSFEETVIRTRSRSQSLTSASYRVESNVAVSNADWDNEQESKIDFPLDGINGVMPPNMDPYEESENSTEKNPVESVFSDDTDGFSDHTQYSHLAPINTVPRSPTSPVSLSVSMQGQQEVFPHHHINLPTSARRQAESRGTPTNFGKMVQNRMSIQSEDEGSALSYATYV